MKLEALMMQSDNRFARKANKGINRATEGRRYAGRRELWSQEDTDKELADIKRELVRLELKLRQDKKMVQVCEPEIEKILGEENGLRSTKDLKSYHEGREEILVFQVGNELRSAEDLTDCQEDNQGISHCQLGNERRSLGDLEDCQEDNRSIKGYQVARDKNVRPYEFLMDSEESSIQQGMLMKMGSVDLIVCQEGSRDIPHF
jgi:hypothetical protein